MWMFLMGALCMSVAMFSCEKETAAVRDANPNGQSTGLLALADLQPNYVYTLAGNPDKFNQDNGKFDQAGFMSLDQMVADDGYLYGIDAFLIRKIRISDSTVTTLAGSPGGGGSIDGQGSQASFSFPTAIALGPDGNLYIADNFHVRKVTKEGLVTTIAGSTYGNQDGPAQTARFTRLVAITVCNDGAIYVIDVVGLFGEEDYQIRKITPSGMVSTLVKRGAPGSPASNWEISALAIAPNGSAYASGIGIFKVSETGQVTTLNPDIVADGHSLLALEDGSLFVSSQNQIKKVSVTGSVSIFAGLAVTDQFGRPTEGPADSVDLHTPGGLSIYNNILFFSVHPAFFGDPDFPNQLGHVIQMIPLAK
jgi:hypothetical protein